MAHGRRQRDAEAQHAQSRSRRAAPNRTRNRDADDDEERVEPGEPQAGDPADRERHAEAASTAATPVQDLRRVRPRAVRRPLENHDGHDAQHGDDDGIVARR